MTLLIDHGNDPPMGEMGIAGKVTKRCVTVSTQRPEVSKVQPEVLIKDQKKAKHEVKFPKKAPSVSTHLLLSRKPILANKNS